MVVRLASGFIVAAALTWVIALALAGISQDEVNRACQGRGGVISYQEHPWGLTDGTATVVCGNHIAYKLK